MGLICIPFAWRIVSIIRLVNWVLLLAPFGMCDSILLFDLASSTSHPPTPILEASPLPSCLGSFSCFDVQFGFV